MFASIRKYCVLFNAVFVCLIGFVSSEVFSFDLKAVHKEIIFTQVTMPACGDQTQYLPALPKDPRAELYYEAARKILGQNDDVHFKHMYILADKAAQMGHWKAKLMMANLYLRNTHNNYSDYNPTKAKKYVLELIEQNVPEAFYVMGQYKLNGMPEFVKDPIPASVYLFEAAKLNYPKALADMYDTFMSVGRAKEAKNTLACAVKQKQDTASSLYKMANVLEEQATTEQLLIEAFKFLYNAAKMGSYDAIDSFPNKERYFEQQYNKAFFSKEFLARIRVFQDAMNSFYTHEDPYRKSKGIDPKVKGNIYLTFPRLEAVVPFPPSVLPEWKEDISIALDPPSLTIYRTDFNYDQLVKEATAIKVEQLNPKAGGKKDN